MFDSCNNFFEKTCVFFGGIQLFLSTVIYAYIFGTVFNMGQIVFVIFQVIGASLLYKIIEINKREIVRKDKEEIARLNAIIFNLELEKQV